MSRRPTRKTIISESSSLASQSESSMPSESQSLVSVETPSTSTGLSSTPAESEIFSIPSSDFLYRELRHGESDTSSQSGRSLRSGRSSAASSRDSSKSRGSSQSSSGSETTERPKWSIASIDEITGDKLPSNEQIIAFYIHLRLTNPIMKSSRIVEAVYDELIRFYRNLNIPTLDRKDVEKRISRLYAKYQDVKNIQNRKRPMYDTEASNVNEFMRDLENLFDISPLDAQIDTEEYRQFLENQRLPGRIGTMRGISRRRKPSRLLERVSVPTRVVEREEVQAEATAEVPLETTSEALPETMAQLGFTQSDSSDTSSTVEDDDKDPDYVDPTDRPKRRISFINEEMVGAMDACRISSPCAVRLLIPTLKALNLNPHDYIISETTISRKRLSKRSELFKRAHKDFLEYVTENKRVVQIHWDGKTVRNITDNRKLEERIAVKVVCDGREQVMGCPVSSKKAESVSGVVYQLIVDWDLTEFVESLCFDTENVNSGRHTGVAVRLERLLGRPLQFFPCRHHIYELVLKLVYHFFMGETKSDNVKLFADFKAAWTQIDQSNYSAGISDDDVSAALRPQLRSELKEFILDKLKNKVFRSDYREFLELSLLFIGGKLDKPDDRVTFHPPGADHHARWMSKAIYSLKMFMFRFEYDLSAEDLAGLKQVNIFIIKYYLKAWFRCPLPSEAPFQDFNFMKSVLLDRNMNKDLALELITTFSRHLWYLEEQTVALAFFDETIPVEIMTEMVARLDVDDEESVVQNGHRVVAKAALIQQTYLTKKFSDFVNSNTMLFFEKLGIPKDFLEEPVSTWRSSASYRKAREMVKLIKVTNDTAERTVQLMTAYVGLLTRKDSNYQQIVAVVEEYRKKNPSYTKKDLSASK